MGFRANLDDQYRVEIGEHLDESQSDQSRDSDDDVETDDEIFRKLDRVVFRPTATNPDFSFSDQPAVHERVSLLTQQHSSQPVLIEQQSAQSQKATGGSPSICSLEERAPGYRPRQRAHSQFNEDQQNTPEGDEWEASFPGASQAMLNAIGTD